MNFARPVKKIDSGRHSPLKIGSVLSRFFADNTESSRPGEAMEVAKDFEEFFASFNAHRVQYLIVGGLPLHCMRTPDTLGS
jgi:hypothetical protein